MSVVEGIDQFEEFSDDIGGVIDGLSEARKNAIEATANDYINALTGRIRSSETVKGGTFYSESSPYSPGGTNDSTGSTKHIQYKNAWVTDVIGEDLGVVYPDPEVRDRVRFLEYGTKDHGPDDETPMYFKSGGVTIVVAEKPDRNSPFYTPYTQLSAIEGQDEARFAFGDISGDAGEVSGVEPQRFIKNAFEDTKRGNRFKKNMGKELDKLFERNNLPITGAWI